jgi:ATP-dependent exoDNAse (exonuclease V) alpha subunit
MTLNVFLHRCLSSVAIASILAPFTKAEDSPPLPPTRVEEMQQRIDAYVKKGGDARAKGLLHVNREAIIQLEDSARRMMETYSTIDPNELSDIEALSPNKLDKLIAVFSAFQSAGQTYFDTLKRHREITTACINTLDPNLTSGILSKTEKNYNLTRAWGNSAIAGGNASLSYLRRYKEEKINSAEAFDTMLLYLRRYEELQEAVLSISKTNQHKLEKDLPR